MGRVKWTSFSTFTRGNNINYFPFYVYECFFKDYEAYLCPHPVKAKAGDKCVVMMPLTLFTDDTSGNKSKKWHKFDSWSVMMSGLPRHENAKIENIHFYSCSDVVSAVEMAEALVSELIMLENDGVEVYDALIGERVIAICPVMCILVDNPRASELLNHLGGSAKRYCRMCMVHNNYDYFGNQLCNLYRLTEM